MKIKAFLQRHIAVTRTRGSLITACVVTALLLAAVLFSTGSYLEDPSVLRVLLFVGCLLLPFGVGAIIAFRVELKHPWVNRIVNVALFFLLPMVTITMTEALNNVFVYDMTYFGFIANYILVLLFEGLVFVCSGSLRLPILIVNPLLFGMALAHYFLMMYRATPFVPLDFTTLGVADAILGQYEYRLEYQAISALVLLAFILAVGYRLVTPRFALLTRILSRALTGLVFAAVMIAFFFTSFFSVFGVKPDFWNQARGYRNFGFTYSFFINTKYLYVLEPSGYDPEAVEGYVEQVLQDEEEPETDSQRPDVICIMNEALSDLSVLGEVNWNKNPLEFISSLRENTVRGTLYVPVIGAGTSNTEFEFLTGNSTAFFPYGSNAYILYVKQKLHTLPALLSAQGYAVNYMHPYYANGWNRNKIYQDLGFSDFVSIEDMLDMSIFDRYKEAGSDVNYLAQMMEEAYPGENVLIRQYVSDEYNYNWIINDYENRDQNAPYFMFNVTMQNHAPYRENADNFKQYVWLEGANQYYNTSRYLSLVRHSDNAFRDLISYFETVDRPVVICMFGDHQPAINTGFVEDTLGASVNQLNLAQQQARHATPFLIWANYDIEEAEYEALSSNYLSSLVMKTAKLPMSDYNRYLLKLSETLPIIDTVGYMDADGKHYSWEKSSPYSELLYQYERVQYNGLFDTKNRKDALFTVQ